MLRIFLICPLVTTERISRECNVKLTKGEWIKFKNTLNPKKNGEKERKNYIHQMGQIENK